MNADRLHGSQTLKALLAVFFFAGVTQAPAQDTGTLDQGRLVEKPEPYSPYVDQHFPQRVLWGDAHHHTSLSVDSGMIGNNNSPDVSFRLARGEEVTSNSGLRVQLVRPLDFLVVTDHAEYLGIAKLLNEADPALLATDVGKEWYAKMNGSPQEAWQAVVSMQKDFTSGVPRFADPKVTRTVWEDVVDIASKIQPARHLHRTQRIRMVNGQQWERRLWPGRCQPAPGRDLSRRARSGEADPSVQRLR